MKRVASEVCRFEDQQMWLVTGRERHMINPQVHVQRHHRLGFKCKGQSSDQYRSAAQVLSNYKYCTDRSYAIQKLFFHLPVLCRPE